MEDGTWKKLYQKWFPGSPMREQYLPKAEQTASPARASRPAPRVVHRAPPAEANRLITGQAARRRPAPGS